MESHSEDKSHKVQFTEEADEMGHDSDITVRTVGQNIIEVHLGFLQIKHRYEIAFDFKSQPIDGELVVRNQDSSPNLNLHVIDLRKDSSKDGLIYNISVELFAHKEKLIKEQLCLQSSENPSQTINVVLHARVLGKGKGTPFLKNGIKCIGQEMDEDDDNSDWPGFS